VCVHTSCETSAHKKTWSDINVHSKNLFAQISYTSFQIQTSSGRMFAQKKFYVHTDFEKLDGTLVRVRTVIRKYAKVFLPQCFFIWGGGMLIIRIL